MSSNYRSNEGMACDAVLRFIEAREGQKRRDLTFPEKMHEDGPVELVCFVGEQRFAFEHTRIEPFPGHIQLEAEAKRHFEPIADMLVGQLSAEERFELQVPVGILLGKNDREVRPIQEALVRWVIEVAPTLPIAKPWRYSLPIVMVAPPGVPFMVSLHRQKREGFPIFFRVTHRMVEDLETARLKRITDAYARKLPKLQKWKDSGARTILILEEDDIQLTNHWFVGDAVLKIEVSMKNRADEVYLLSTATSRWSAIPLRVDDRTFVDAPTTEHWETAPHLLDDITGNMGANDVSPY